MSFFKKFFSVITISSITLVTVCSCNNDPSASQSSGYGKSKYPEQITIDVYDQEANFKGIQNGWFGDELLERFNVKLNIIAPNVDPNGQALMDVRAASGSIGDIIICSANNNALEALVEQGLLLNMEDYIKDKEVMKYESAITRLNQGLDGIYAIPSELSTASVTEPLNIKEPNYGPYLRWDIYSEVGYPQMDTLEDLLDVLVLMKEKEPYSDSGEETYGFSFFSDWDLNMMNAAKQPCCFYGYDEYGFVLAKADGSDYQSILDDDSLYMRVLKLYFDANQLGLVDPDSRTNTYTDVYDKYQDGQILYCPWPFLGQSAYNSLSNMEQGKGFMLSDISDMEIYAYGAYDQGNVNNVIAIGADTKDPQRMMDIINWLYTDEGIYANQASNDSGSAGPIGICWEMGEDGPYLTDYGKKVFQDASNDPIPGYDGSFRDGISRLNFSAVNLKELDSNGYPYAYLLWDSELSKDKTVLEENWSEYMNALSSEDYLEKNEKILVAPGCVFVNEAETTEIKEIRDACKAIIIQYSWDMVFAPDQAHFNAIKKEMQRLCMGLGYSDVLEYDMEGAAKQGSMRQAAIAEENNF